MINNKYKCIFIEVPKTGSTSIRSIIGCPEKPHKNIIQIKNEIDKELFNQYYKFGFVRNPWDRVVSLYKRKEGIQMADKMSFEEFVNWIQYSSDTSIHPLQHKYQIDWFLDENGLVAVDFIGKFENLNSDWNKIQKVLGIDVQLPHLNVNVDKKRHYSEYYTEKTKEIINNKFKKDIEYFDYEFEG